jgi:hypothetical protein
VHSLVLEERSKQRIVGHATLLVHNSCFCVRVGHVEDVIVDEDYRGLKLGARCCSFLESA